MSNPQVPPFLFRKRGVLVANAWVWEGPGWKAYVSECSGAWEAAFFIHQETVWDAAVFRSAQEAATAMGHHVCATHAVLSAAVREEAEDADTLTQTELREIETRALYLEGVATDAAFIAAARQDIPRLLSDLREAKALCVREAAVDRAMLNSIKCAEAELAWTEALLAETRAALLCGDNGAQDVPKLSEAVYAEEVERTAGSDELRIRAMHARPKGEQPIWDDVGALLYEIDTLREALNRKGESDEHVS